MEATVVAVLAALSATAGALVAWLVCARSRPRSPYAAAPADAGPAGALPPAVRDVLSVLRSSSAVVDPADLVVAASPGAYAFGLVQQGRLTTEPLRVVVSAVRRAGGVRDVELELPRGPLGGETFNVAARVAPLGGGHVLVLVEDRTDARRVDAVRRDFVANVSHELKTPVGALSLLAEAVLDASDDPEAVRHFAERMQIEANRLAHLVQELIDLSRLQGHDPLRAATLVDLDAVVAEAIERCRLAAGRKSIALHAGGETGLRVLGDENQLMTAIRNLIDNAVSYSPEHTRVAVAVRRTGDLVEIQVTDQGIGIPERDLERIFERFYRVDPARSRATGGTGLGLSIVKHITANHGGEVTVWSLEGAGSTFTVRLPVSTDAPDGGSGAQPSGDRHTRDRQLTPEVRS